MWLRSQTYREKRTWATGAIPIGAPGRFNSSDKEMGVPRPKDSLTGMARVGFSNGIYGKGTDGCNRNIVRLGLGKGHGDRERGGKGKGVERDDTDELFIGKITPHLICK